jgi:hypothetical protein
MKANIKNKVKPWTNIHKTKYEWLFNYLKKHYDDIKRESYIDDNKRALMGIIDKNKNWGDSSKEGLYFMISRYLFNKKNNDRYVKIYSQKGFELMKKTHDKEATNVLDEKEQENYKDREYFIDILKNTTEGSTLKTHYEYLLLSLLVLQPPLRTSFYNSAKLLKTLDTNNKKDNYIYINRRGKVHAYYFVNTDKASNYKLYKMDPNLSKIEIEDPQLSNLLNESFKKYPRLYLFEINKKPVSQTTLLRMLRNITGVDGINFDIMRSSYITWYYKHNKQYGKRDELSKRMRHSQATASKNYLKIFDEENENELKEPTQENYLETISQLNNNIRELQNKLKVSEKEDNETVYKKRRADIIYKINKKGVIPKSSTLDKYKILIDEKAKIYY